MIFRKSCKNSTEEIQPGSTGFDQNQLDRTQEGSLRDFIPEKERLLTVMNKSGQTGCLGDLLGDEISYPGRDYFINHEIRIPMKQPLSGSIVRRNGIFHRINVVYCGETKTLIQTSDPSTSVQLDIQV